jgi:acetyl esterase/lipase
MPPPPRLDPELVPVIEALPPVVLREDTLAALRQQQLARPPAAPLSDGVTRTDHLVAAGAGEAAVAVRVHRAVGVGAGAGTEGRLPGIVSMHGGGLVLGSHAADDALFDRWCPALGVVGIAVDYRLAPETPYPGALEDCYAALRWAHDEADALGIDRARLGVRGISAGAGLAAAVALLARERGAVDVAFQLLDSPMLDDRQLTPSSRQDGLALWTREANAFGWQAYLGDLYGSDDVPATAAAARATDLAGLPPAFVSVGTADGFRDEAVDYAMRLNQAGVPCELHVYAGAPHGYHLAGESSIARQASRDMTAWLTRIIGSK